MRSLLGYNRDYYGGALMILIGLGTLFGGMKYHLGTLEEIGSGFFPTAVGAILAVVGVAIALSASSPTTDEERARSAPEWRGWSCIIGGTVAFVVLGVYGGLVPATFAIVFISALGDKKTTVKQAFLLAIALVAVSAIVFHWALELELPLFTWD